MDPDALLREIRGLTKELYDEADDGTGDRQLRLAAALARALELAGSLQALDRWLVNGGALPAAWKRGSDACSQPAAL